MSLDGENNHELLTITGPTPNGIHHTVPVSTPTRTPIDLTHIIHIDNQSRPSSAIPVGIDPHLEGNRNQFLEQRLLRIESEMREGERERQYEIKRIHDESQMQFVRMRDNMIAEMKQQENVKELEGMEKIRKEVLDDMILPDNKKYISSSLCCINVWNLFATTFTALKYLIMILFVPTLSFAASSYPDRGLNFAAGILSLLGIACEKLGVFCTASAKKRNEKMNKMIKALGIDYRVSDTSFGDPEVRTGVQSYEAMQRIQVPPPYMIPGPYRPPQRVTTQSAAQEMYSLQYGD